MADVGRHPSIKVLTNTDIDSVEGEAGNFAVTVTRRPRYVDETLCRGCGTCSSYCPYTLPNPFDENLSHVKAIDIPCSQAVPAVAVVDRETCLYFQEKKCNICPPVCQAKAIDLNQKRKIGIMRVGAIVVSPGCEVFDAKASREYGFRDMKNVVSSQAFERILDADGPYKGELLRPSDGKVPYKIAWLQCVGSRDIRSDRTYCSSVCCTYAVKQALIVKHQYPASQVTIFHNDIRTYGKGYEDLYNRVRDMEGARFIQSRPEILEDLKNSNLMVQYVADNRIIRETFDMVVLSTGMVDSEGNRSLARIMGLPLNEHGFCKTGSFSPNEIADCPGIFPAATFLGPMDIPDAVSSATGAGSLAAQLLHRQRGQLAKEKVYPPERSITGEEPEIGVFICHCGTNIAGKADLSSLVQYTAALNNVVHCEDQLISCASASFREISDVIKEKKLNRLVVAACTPKTHEPIFREALREAGLNPYLLEMANIREHCTWVHSQDREEATQKAKDIIAMAVARSRNLSPLKPIRLPVHKKGLVIGGGLAGITAATALANQGFEVFIVEKERELGGNLRNLHYTLDGEAIKPFLENMKQKVESEKKIRVFKGYELKSLSGFKGNFKSTFENESSTIELEHGIIIVATGGEVFKPDEYQYGNNNRVVIQQELEEMIASGTLPQNLERVVMIQCVGSRNIERPYCSRICCGEAVKNALKLKELNNALEIFVFYRDMRTYGFNENYYLQARKKGIQFIRYKPGKHPKLTTRGESLSLTFFEPILEMELVMSSDLLVLSTPVIPKGNPETAKLLKVPMTKDGFFMEAHMKLSPLDFAMEGIFLCGMAHYPKNIPETISQANGAALRAATVLSKDMFESSGAICEIDAKACTGCRLCEEICPYNAISVQRNRAMVIPAICKGCGICSSICREGAITIHHSTDQQIVSQIDAAYSVPGKKAGAKVLAFLCNWCGYPGADLAGTSRIQYAPNVRIIRVMCSGRIDPSFIYHAFLKGIDGVLVVGCHSQDCHYISGVKQTTKTISASKKILKKAGIDPERLRLEHISAAEGGKFAELINHFTAAMNELRSLQLDGEQVILKRISK